MITTDIKSALRQTIQDFYGWSQSPHAEDRKHTYDNIKGIFLNKLKSNLKGTNITYPMYNRVIHDIIGINNVNFEIIEGKIRKLVFTMTNGYNKAQEELMESLNTSVNELDFLSIEKKNNFTSSFKEEVDQIINNINNFKIPQLT